MKPVPNYLLLISVWLIVGFLLGFIAGALIL
jgi:hypothetical protein